MSWAGNRWKPHLILVVLLVMTVAWVPTTAGAEPSLKVTHECQPEGVRDVSGGEFLFLGGIEANSETSCHIALKAIYHGNARKGKFRTKRWVCKTQEKFAGVGGERLKCRRGEREAFEFAWSVGGA